MAGKPLTSGGQVGLFPPFRLFRPCFAHDGIVANWGLVGAAVYDASFKGPEIIDMNMTGVMIGYSSLFMRFAWMVQPRNYLLFACHSFNVAAQMNQLRRAIEYKLSNVPDASEELTRLGKKAAFALVGLGAALYSARPLQQKILASQSTPSFLRSLVSHPAGPFTIFFWAPTSKWLLSGTNLLNLDKPTDTISLAQTLALTATGVIWTRYSFVITPVNINLAVVNTALGLSSGYHLMRKIRADYFSGSTEK
jgi:mitochondrial pyruvate carrier 2